MTEEWEDVDLSKASMSFDVSAVKKQGLRPCFFLLGSAFSEQMTYPSRNVKIPDDIIASTPNHKMAAITLVISILRTKFGFAGAEVACPFSICSGALAPNGKTMNKTHHHKRM